MRKFLILVVTAAAIGVFISQTREPEGEASAADAAPPAMGSAAEVADAATPAPAAREASAPPASSPRPAPAEAPARAAAPSPAPEEPPAQRTHSEPAPAPQQPDTDATPRQVASRPDAEPTETASSQERPALSAVAELPTDAPALERAAALLKDGERVEARRILSAVYREGPTEHRAVALKALNRINSELVFNPRCTEGAVVHTVSGGETLGRIGGKHKVNWRGIQRLNGVDPRRIRKDQQLKILPGEREILVDKSDFRLALFIDGYFIKQYPIGHGKDNKTPTGKFTIDEMMIEPDWYPPWGGVVRYGEKGHLIGERWLGLADQPGAAGYGIHGTSDPQSIGTLCSNGCIRMLNEDVKELYDFVTSGTTVTIVE